MAATGLPTLIDILKRKDADDLVGLINEAQKAIPEVTVVPARTIKSLNFKTRVRVANPTVSFRNANEGVAASKGRIENRLVECFLMNPRWNADKAVADVYEDGPNVYMAEEGVAFTEAGFQTIASQFYYGVTLDANKGFPGLISGVDASLVLDAGGTTDNTCSSVWGVRFGRQDVEWVWGQNAEFALSDLREGDVLDAQGNPFTAYIQELTARPGLKIGSKYSVGRIKKLTADNGKGLTDNLIAEFLTKFPVGKKPDVLFMSQRSLEQLRKSRTATNATGAPAPTPTESHNVPIHATESILDTESLAL
jgi:hypothetical protein